MTVKIECDCGTPLEVLSETDMDGVQTFSVLPCKNCSFRLEKEVHSDGRLFSLAELENWVCEEKNRIFLVK